MFTSNTVILRAPCFDQESVQSRYISYFIKKAQANFGLLELTVPA